MKFLYIIILTTICMSCSMDNKAYPLQLESIIKTNSTYQLKVSTTVDLTAIKNKHQFPEERFICTVKNRDFRAQHLIINGQFSTKSQEEINGKYIYTVDLNIQPENSAYNLTPKDTLIGYLQLSYDIGRTYPTKSVEIPAEKILQLK